MKFTKASWLVSVLIGFGVSVAIASVGSDDGIYKEVPLPFDTTNQRVELAPGELYTLYGKVFAARDEVLLRVDLKKHSWLATIYRKNYPFYVVEAPAREWRCLDGRDVLMQFKAVLVRTSADMIAGIRLIPVRAKLGCEE